MPPSCDEQSVTHVSGIQCYLCPRKDIPSRSFLCGSSSSLDWVDTAERKRSRGRFVEVPLRRVLLGSGPAPPPAPAAVRDVPPSQLQVAPAQTCISESRASSRS